VRKVIEWDRIEEEEVAEGVTTYKEENDMTKVDFEKLGSKVESHLRKVLNYPVSANGYDDECEVSVYVDTYEVNEDPVGCMHDIIDGVSSKFPELVSVDTECHEMVVVTFKLNQGE